MQLKPALRETRKGALGDVKPCGARERESADKGEGGRESADAELDHGHGFLGGGEVRREARRVGEKQEGRGW